VGEASVAARWLIYDLVRGSQGDLWTASHDGVWRMEMSPQDTTFTQFSSADDAPAAPVVSISSEGDFLVAASSVGEMSVYSHSTGMWTPWPLQDALPSGATTAIRRVLLHDGIVYAATNAGLVVANATDGDLSSASVLSGSNGYADDLRDLAFDADGFLLVASNIGLLRTDPDLSRWRRLAESHGLSSGDLSAVATRGTEIWLGSRGSGLMRHVFVAPDTSFDREPDQVVGTRDLLSMEVSAIDPDSPAQSAAFQWRVDGGAWSVAATDRTIAFVPSDEGLQHGTHRVQVRAVDLDFNVESVAAEATFELDMIPPVPFLRAPLNGAAVAGMVSIVGTADDLRFSAYRVSVRRRDTADPTEVELVAWTSTAIRDDVVASWNSADGSFGDGWYILELSVRDTIDVIGTVQVELLVDNEFPFVHHSSPQTLQATTGGVVYDLSGAARVPIPPFALNRDQEIRLEAQTEASAMGGFAFELEAEQARFDKSITLRIETTIASAKLDAAIYRSDGSGWIRLGGTEASGGVFDVAIDRPGRFALRADLGEPATGGAISGLEAEPRLLRAGGGAVDRMAISFTLGRASTVHATIYSRNGRPRRVLAEGLSLGSGNQVLFWDGRDEDGARVPPALYIVCVEAGDERVTKVVSVGRAR
jgi:hypothetical protein